MRIIANQIVLTNGLSEIGHGKALTMNKKIEEIAEQCWDEHESGLVTFDREKFAELLIRECMDQVELAKNSPFVSLDDAKRMAHFVDVTKKKIQQHFGIK